MIKKRNNSLILFCASCALLAMLFIVSYVVSNRPKPIIEQKKSNEKIDTTQNNDMTQFNRLYKEQEAKKENERLQKEYQEKILKEQIESDKKEMEYLKKRYLDPYKKK